MKLGKRNCFAPFLSAIITLLLLFSSAAYLEASGFALIEQSVTGLGNAYAGGSAGAEDASTIFFNPAGMTRLKGTQVLFGSHLVIPSAQFNNEGSTRINGSSLGTDRGKDAGSAGLVPNFYLSHDLGTNVFVGLGINSPFGLVTDYGTTWIGRYHATKTDMLTININPSIAYKATDYLSFGAGVSAQYMKVEYDSMVDQSALASADGSVINKGDSWGFGFNAGVLVDIAKDARIGLAYRSQIKHKLSGDADFSNINPVLAALRRLSDTDITATVTLPDTLSLSGHYAFNDQWAVMADVTWTNWSVFDEVRIKFQNGAADGVTTTDWKDSWRYSLGLTYKPAAAWTLRTGIAFDQSPVSAPEHRTPRIPDADRLWLSCGFSYTLSKSLGIDFGYTHIFVDDPKINLIATATNENAARGNLRGTIDAQVNILSAQVRWSF